MSCYVVVAQGEHDFSEGACPCGAEPPKLGGKMAADRHVGTPECLNETCACGSLPLTPHIEAVAQGIVPEPERWDGTAWLRKHGEHTDPPCHECERIEQGRVKERREGIATAVLAGLAAFTGKLGDERMHTGETAAAIARQWADALIVELDK